MQSLFFKLSNVFWTGIHSKLKHFFSPTKLELLMCLLVTMLANILHPLNILVSSVWLLVRKNCYTCWCLKVLLSNSRSQQLWYHQYLMTHNIITNVIFKKLKIRWSMLVSLPKCLKSHQYNLGSYNWNNSGITGWDKGVSEGTLQN